MKKQHKAIIEVVCTVAVPYESKRYSRELGEQFTKGAGYVAQLKQSGNYELDNNAGNAVRFSPDEFAQRFEIKK